MLNVDAQSKDGSLDASEVVLVAVGIPGNNQFDPGLALPPVLVFKEASEEDLEAEGADFEVGFAAIEVVELAIGEVLVVEVALDIKVVVVVLEGEVGMLMVHLPRMHLADLVVGVVGMAANPMDL